MNCQEGVPSDEGWILEITHVQKTTALLTLFVIIIGNIIRICQNTTELKNGPLGHH